MPPIDANLDAAGSGGAIVALCTPPGRGGIAVVRISGTQAAAIAALLAPSARLAPRTAALGKIVDADGRAVDRAVVTLFKKPNSYTGEDVAEIACHGSLPVVRFVVERAVELGARLAEPGEFTRRAYLNGRMDLVQAEAVRDLIDAATLYQARIAVRQVEGALSKRIRPLKKQLVECIALLEAGIDFADDDIDVASDDHILNRLSPVSAGIARLADGFRFGKVVRSGFKLAVVGRPNVGKSSLFNRLLSRNRAIVSPAAGTTRDAIHETASFDGIPVELMDTAGIHATGDAVEAEGVERSWQALQEADLALVVFDLSQPLRPEDGELQRRAARACETLRVGNKADLPVKLETDEPLIRVSAKTGEGFDALRRQIRGTALPGLDAAADGTFVTNIRQEGLLRAALQSLARGETAVRGGIPHEMLLLDLYEALQALDGITGATTLDDILDNIFSTFCVGK